MYEHLNATGVLATADDALIKAAKRAYRAAYKEKWRQKKREVSKSFNVMLDASEAAEIGEAARRHRRSTTRFLKECCLAYLKCRYVVPDVLAVSAIRKEMAMTYDLLKGLFNENLLPQQVGRMAMEQMAGLEQRVLTCLQHPKTLDQLVNDALGSDPDYAARLLQFIQNA